MTGTDDPFLIRQLEYGIPRVNQHLRPYMNANYSFVLVDGTTDILITATSTAGNVAIMVRHRPTCLLVCALLRCWQCIAARAIVASRDANAVCMLARAGRLL